MYVVQKVAMLLHAHRRCIITADCPWQSVHIQWNLFKIAFVLSVMFTDFVYSQEEDTHQGREHKGGTHVRLDIIYSSEREIYTVKSVNQSAV